MHTQSQKEKRLSHLSQAEREYYYHIAVCKRCEERKPCSREQRLDKAWIVAGQNLESTDLKETP